MPDDHRIDGALADVVEHPPIGLARLARVGAPVVIDIRVIDGPAAMRGVLLAIGDLAPYAQVVTLRVGRDTGIDRGGCWHRVTLTDTVMAMCALVRQSVSSPYRPRSTGTGVWRRESP